MSHLLIRHTVEDFDAWKPYFDDHDLTRREHGQRWYRLFRSADDPNEVTILFEFDGDVERVTEFFESADLRERMATAGVRGRPEVTFLQQVERRRTPLVPPEVGVPSE
ncbi:MAG: hypothetical protein ABEJ28_09975 [Salinigranum sp.]